MSANGTAAVVAVAQALEELNRLQAMEQAPNVDMLHQRLRARGEDFMVLLGAVDGFLHERGVGLE